jgi:Ca-activated chloride channel family protein
MNAIRLHSIEMLHLLWVLPLIIWVYLYAAAKRKQALQTLLQGELFSKRKPLVDYAKRFWKVVLLVLAVLCIIISLTRPAWNKKETTVKRAGRDVVFVLDVSKSMLAEDLAPNRLERAKLAVLDSVEQLQGDRVALVVFAGTAVVKCPLTLDYGFFRMILETVSPESISRGGTMIGDAVRTVLDQVFDKRETKYKDIVLITDGEDHESFPVEAAKAAGAQGVRLIIVGLGDEHEGKRIPITDISGRKTFLKYQGQEVWTKLDADTLRKMASATPGGRYLPVATGTIDLGEVYMDLIASAEKKELEAKTFERYEEKFQIFLGVAFFLLCLESIMNERKKVRTTESTESTE